MPLVAGVDSSTSACNVAVRDADELVTLGAAVQVAAVLTGGPFDTITDVWGIAAGTTTEPEAAVGAMEIREPYAGACER